MYHELRGSRWQSHHGQILVIMAWDVAQSLFANLQPGWIESLGDLRDKPCSNFKGINTAPNQRMNLFRCKQGEREPLQDYSWRFIRLRAHTPNITDETIILGVVNNLKSGPCSSRLARKPATTVAELHELMEMYCRVDADFRMKTEAQWSQARPLSRPQQSLPHPRRELINVNAIDNTHPPRNSNKPRNPWNPRATSGWIFMFED